MTAMDKDRLAAFVDGELSPEEAAAVVMHLADHPADQAWVDDLIAANETLAAAFAQPLHEPVPEAIRAAIFGTPEGGAGRDADGPAEPAGQAQVLPFRPRAGAARGGRPGIWAAGLALAAGLAAVAVIGPLLRGPAGGGDPGAVALAALVPGPLAEGSALSGLLATQPSGTPQEIAGGQEVMILSSLPLADGRFCRELELLDEAAGKLSMGIACTAGTGWTVEIVLSEALGNGAGEGDGFVTASGPEGQSLDLFLDRLGAGLALDPEAEAKAIAGGWQP
jgi:hypothetical protein